MRYYELTFKTAPSNEAVSDVLAALLADVGCEAFTPTPTGLRAYIQQSLYDEAAVRSVVAAFPLPDIEVSWTCAVAPDENWNATWESAHEFQPVALPGGEQLHIRPRQAFGSGEHPTTQMMLSLLAMVPAPIRLAVDAGCGTGILGIAALRMGAHSVFAYDIDEWSVSNSEYNYHLNIPEGQSTYGGTFTIKHGDSRVLDGVHGATVLMANLNTNIILADIEAFAGTLAPHGTLLLSGFLCTDTPRIIEAAARHGLSHQTTLSNGDWQAVMCVRA